MTTAERLKWAEIAAKLRPAGALAEALAVGYVDNHGEPIGNVDRAAHRLEMLLAIAVTELRQMKNQS